ncbi:Radical SAM superfamily enzyme, MoaA/NifB/PqqE/SkfB family [Anaerocolumna jejuensis DSM 15929]|uniref:Radical SAM superfamily enzyme, MoaA/NifB/PqqE/SkfB family n=1 Tax=Anaerocolumna jejuensis DSM 15929 TaxID=1121322 RepID=A0A1M6QZ19_9FIRM|nr:radical SAM protein [Anaerocolumna jejuensis]SHK25403.1 Radical SAM superfamily enzyme, MoaA/NifB/PqqE/SkfB family [Anaerocolumna jejuensis DSM 15929]
MDEKLDLERYLSNGVENIVKGAIRATLKDPRESIFMAKYAIASKEAARKRQKAKEQSENIPPFLIASITSSCNLHCAGCYARSNHTCSDAEAVSQLTREEWEKIFLEASDLGIGFILLAGGEPMIRKDVIKAAGTIPEIIFPIFTNGTIIDEEYYRMLDQSRNLIPVISIEGHQVKTDQRRGRGVYQKVISAMDSLKERHLTFGASITLTTENMKEVTTDEFIHTLGEKGAKVVFYVEFVPVTEDTRNLAPGAEERAWIKKRLSQIRKQHPEMIFISFPGDEKTSGGCLAAGRGFFHINSHGGAEPCPFSPYSDINVIETSLREAIHSDLFQKLQNQNILIEDHAGGCVLFEKKELVEALL